MDKLISEFTKEIKQALTFGVEGGSKKSRPPFRHVVVCGMGGSGIGGRFVSQFTSKELPVPMEVVQDYTLPAFAGQETLVVISSYSGNTEESLAAMEMAVQKKTQAACISSGGKVTEKATSFNLPRVEIPGGLPPRAAFGYSFTALLVLLEYFGIIGSSFRKALKDAIALLDESEEQIKAKAKQLAENLYGKLPVIYCAASYESVAVRFRQQLNENSKMLCWHHVFPELNHNELVGWRECNDKIAVVLLRNPNDAKRIQRRMALSKQVFEQYTSSVYEVFSSGNTDWARALYLIHLCDWTSFYLALAKGVDVMEVQVIDRLKSALSSK